MVEVFITFLRLGIIGFGGPIALVSLVEREVCTNKQWLSLAQFAEIFSVCKLLPGPLAVQVVICCGYQRRGRLGGLLAGLAFLLPALILITIIGIGYTHGLATTSSGVKWVLKFLQDATLAIILLTTWDLSVLYLKNAVTIIICCVCIGMIYLHPGLEPLTILTFGGLGLAFSQQQNLTRLPLFMFASLPKLATRAELTAWGWGKLFKLFWVCIKAGEFSFGTGLAIIPLLHGDLVSNYHWLSDKQFLDGVTLGQITPGPTTISIVFFGWLVASLPGLLIAVLGFYLPPLFNALVIIPWFWHKLTNSPYLKIFTQWAFPAVIGGILSATIKLGVVAISAWYDVGLILLALVVIKRKLLPLSLVIPLYGLVGLAVGVWH